MYFQAPPDGAARALLDKGTASQRAGTGNIRSKTRSSTKKVVGSAIGTQLPAAAAAAAAAASASESPKTRRPVKRTEGVEEPDELTAINSRVEEIVKTFEAGPIQDDDFTTLGKVEFNELKSNIKGLFEKQAVQSEGRTVALANTVAAIDAASDLGDTEYLYAAADDKEAATTKLLISDDKGMEVKGLVGEVSLQHQNTAKKLEVVHKKEQAIVKELKERTRELEKKVEEEHLLVLGLRDHIVGLTMDMDELEAKFVAQQVELSCARDDAQRMTQELQAQFSKPPPPPPAISDDALDKLRAELERTKRKLGDVEAELIWKGEELKQAALDVLAAKEQLDAAEARHKMLIEEQALLKAKYESEIKGLQASNTELQRKAQDADAMLAARDAELLEEMEKAKKAQDEAAARVAEAWASVHDSTGANEAEYDAALAKAAADFEKQLASWRQRAIKAEQEAEDSEARAQKAAQASQAARAANAALESAAAKDAAAHAAALAAASGMANEQKQADVEAAAKCQAEKDEMRDRYEKEMAALRERYESQLAEARSATEAMRKQRDYEAREAKVGAKLAAPDAVRMAELEGQVSDLREKNTEMRNLLKNALAELDILRADNKSMKESLAAANAKEKEEQEKQEREKQEKAAAVASRIPEKELVGFKRTSSRGADKIAEEEPAGPVDAVVASEREEAVAAALDPEIRSLENELARTQFQFKNAHYALQSLREEKNRLEQEKKSAEQELQYEKGRADSLADKEREVSKELAQARTTHNAEKAEMRKRAEAELAAKVEAVAVHFMQKSENSSSFANSHGSALLGEIDFDGMSKRVADNALASANELNQALDKLRANEAKLADANAATLRSEEAFKELQSNYDTFVLATESKLSEYEKAKLATDLALSRALQREEELQVETGRLRESLADMQGELLQKCAERDALRGEVEALERSSSTQMASLMEALEADRTMFQQQIQILTEEVHKSKKGATKNKLTEAIVSNRLAQNLKEATEERPSDDLLDAMQLKMKMAELERDAVRYRGQIEGLETESAKRREAIASLESENSAQRKQISDLESSVSQAEMHAAHLSQSVAEMTEALESNAAAAQAVMTDLQSNSKAQAREMAQQARAQADAFAQEYKQRAFAAEASLESVQRAAEEKIASLQRDLSKLMLAARQQQGTPSRRSRPETPAQVAVLPPAYVQLRNEVKRVQEAALSILKPPMAAQLEQYLQTFSMLSENSDAAVLSSDTRVLAALAETLSEAAGAGDTLMPSAVQHVGQQLAGAAPHTSTEVVVHVPQPGSGLPEQRVRNRGQRTNQQQSSSCIVTEVTTHFPQPSSGPDSADQRTHQGAWISGQQQAYFGPPNDEVVYVAQPSLGQPGSPGQRMTAPPSSPDEPHSVKLGANFPPSRPASRDFGSAPSAGRTRQLHHPQRIAQIDAALGQTSNVRTAQPRPSKTPSKVTRSASTSAILLDPLPRPKSMPGLPLAAGQPPGSQLLISPEELRPEKTAAELYARDHRGATPMQKQQKKMSTRRAWLAHSEGDDEFDIGRTCTCAPLTAGARPVTQPSQPRAPVTLNEAASRSFWAQELPSLTGSGPGIALQAVAAHAQELALDALLSRSTSTLDELAAALVEMLGLVDKEKHPTLVAAIHQAGVQDPKEDKAEKPLMAAPSRHDVVLLISALSAQITYGVAGFVTTSTPGASAIDDRFKREVAELRRTLQQRSDKNPAHAISPRFSQMAQAIISKEEQLQRMKEVYRNQRAANQKSLDRVQKSLEGMVGLPSTETHRVLQRMEKEHLEAAQRWEYKSVCLQEERKRLMELAMKACCKVVYSGPMRNHRTLVHGHIPGGDPEIVPTALLNYETTR